MGILDAYRRKKSLAAVLAAQDAASPGTTQAIARLKKLGRPAIPKLIDGLGKAQSPEILVDVLTTFLDNKTLPLFAHYLSQPDSPVGVEIVKVFAKSNKYDPNQLLNLFSDTSIPKVVLGRILAQHKDKLNFKALLALLHTVDKDSRAVILRLIDQMATASMLPDLIRCTRSENVTIRFNVARVLARFSTEAVRNTLLNLLADPHKNVRQVALEGLANMPMPLELGPICQLLQDPDPTIQNKAMAVLIQAHYSKTVSQFLDVALGDKRTMPVLLRMLQEDTAASPMVIRALSALGDRQAIAPLLAQLQTNNQAVRKEALRALAVLTDAAHASDVLQAVMAVRDTSDQELKELANGIANTLISKWGDKAVVGKPPADMRPTVLPQHQSLLHDTLAEVSLEAIVLALPDLPATVSDLPASAHATERCIDAATLEPGVVLTDRYRVIRRVGQGGFGTVMLVEDLMVGEEIILKFLNPHVAADDSMIKRFIHELRYARRITHENVIRIHDFLLLGKSYAISMEYFPSHSLAEELKDGVPLNPKRGLKIIWDLCRGIGVAHQVGVVHRDLKPPNILINEHGVVKVVDFGLAVINQADSRLTRTGVLLGTPTYMAPEQIRSRTIDARTDIYSIGVIMYEMLTGRPPYTGDNPMSVLFKHVEGNPTPPRKIQPDLAPGLEAIILKAMEVDPAKRFQSMEALRTSIIALTKQGSR